MGLNGSESIGALSSSGSFDYAQDDESSEHVWRNDGFVLRLERTGNGEGAISVWVERF